MPFPGQLALVTGLVSSSYFTLGNFFAAYAGIIPGILPKNSPSLPISDRLALWKVWYAVGLVHMVAAGLTTAIALSLAAFFSSEPSLRKLLAVGAVSAVSLSPFTFIAIFPVNDELARMAYTTRNLDVNSAQGKREEQRALKNWTSGEA
ncbi:hypothetical protein C8J57DRAFT_1242986 [Mycena rebaudengoi]|nr:hypothetical protein C8J57DRAFT_1242986 [Mycena rebaudengoi]